MTAIRSKDTKPEMIVRRGLKGFIIYNKIYEYITFLGKCWYDRDTYYRRTSVVLALVVLLSSKPDKNPTWTGLIISLLTGTIVLYLILCYFGILGEERTKEGSVQI